MTLLVTLVVGTLTTLAFPYHAVTPGALSAGHERLANDCLACHTPLRGPIRDKCQSCHQLERIGVLHTDGRPRVPAMPRTSLVHKALGDAGTQCYSCHGEHSGASRATAGMRFTHAVLPATLRGDCLTCHAGERPNDALHANREATCSACHGAEAWKPATIDHDRYFRFDTHHPSTCATCHQVPSDYKRYTCYGCHEHTPAK
ncbi:MAG: class III cytochrome C family protein, partial [Acidobacteria bacterium]|nr:class III cytochrome C family protein [Acidobacteriota bacterium]